MRTRILIAAIAAALVAVIAALLAGGTTSAPFAPRSAAVGAAAPGAGSAAAPTRSLALPAADGPAPTLDALLGGLTSAGDEALGPAMKDAYFALVEALRGNPELVTAIEVLLATADREDPQARVALGALVGAGTPEAQAALGRLLDARRGDADFVKLIVPSVGFLDHPTPAIEAAVRALASDDPRPQIRTMAGLSVGIMASHLDVTDPARARAIVADIDARLLAAATPADIGAQLTVLGNAGTADAGRVATRYLGDDRAAVRASALEALRRVTSPDAESALLRALAADPDPTVRASAAWAMGHRPATPANLRAQAAALLVEDDERVARSLADNLWNGADADRGFAIATLETVATSHALPPVRDAVRALLASQPGT
jgi:HEAT repeat protein